MTKYIIISFLFFGLFTACKSASITKRKLVVKPLNTTQILQNLHQSNVSAKTILAKIKVKFSTAKNTQNITANLRLQKDQMIWISLTAIGGIPVAKILITPNRVSYYEKLNKTYFEGDFSLLNSWLKADLNFDKIQNMLFAQPIESVKNTEFISSIINYSYQLKAKNKIDNSNVTYWVNPENFKLDKQQFSKNKKEFLAFSYLGFDNSTKDIFPNRLQIVAKSKKQTIKIDLTYKSIRFNMPLNFPFKIPEGYNLLKIK